MLIEIKFIFYYLVTVENGLDYRFTFIKFVYIRFLRRNRKLKILKKKKKINNISTSKVIFFHDGFLSNSSFVAKIIVQSIN